MVSKDITIESELGIHLRPAGAMCEEAVKYNSRINFEYGKDKTANAKSVISILAAGVKCGDIIHLTASGDDETAALAAVADAFIKSMREEG